MENAKLLHTPHIPMLKERNVRSGFFEPAQVVSVTRHLNEAEGRVVEFAYLTGWRIDSEVTRASRRDRTVGVLPHGGGASRRTEEAAADPDVREGLQGGVHRGRLPRSHRT